jgi:hypothetical protein
MSVHSSVNSKPVLCDASKEILPDTPDNIGARAGNDVLKMLSSKADLYDQIFIKDGPQACSKSGSILIALVIAPSGKVLDVKKIASTFIDNFVEVHLFETLANINFGQIKAQENSTIYVPVELR